MRILVTGSSGLVGGAVASHLAAQGHEVIGLSRHASSQIPLSVRQVQADIGSPSFLDAARKLIPVCEVIVHAAADRSPRLDQSSVSTTNCLGTQQLLVLATEWTARFLFMSGVAVIGRPLTSPITEKHPANPLNLYIASKLFGEHAVACFDAAGGVGASFRLTAPVGADMPRDRLLPMLIDKAKSNTPIVLHGNGSRRQDYVDVRDVARAVEQWIERPCGGVFNVAAGQTVSNLELAELCIRAVRSDSPIQFSGQPDAEDGVEWNVSCAKALSAFEYVPQHALADLIATMA